MIERAKADTKDAGIQYQLADLETLELSEAAFDLVYSALTFHCVRDCEWLIRMIHTALAPGGDLVFTIEHPIFMAASHSHWTLDAGRRQTKDMARKWLLYWRASAAQTGSPTAC